MAHVLNILVLAATAAVVLASARIIYNIYLHPLRKYPGPKLWAATRLTWARAMQSGGYHHKLHDLHKRYGPVVRVAPDELSFIDARAWKDIYGNDRIPKNQVWAGQEEKHHPRSIVSTNEATHLKNRRALAGAFTEHAITEHAHIFEHLTDLMVQRFHEATSKEEGTATVDIADWFNFLTFDISSALSFGESFNSVSEGRAHPWVEISCSFGKGIALVASINFFRPLDRLMKLAMPQKILSKMQYHRSLTHEKLMQRLSMTERKTTQDFVGSITAYNAAKEEVRIPEEEIEANMSLLIFAGSETSSTALTAIVTELVRSPVALVKATDEVRNAFGTIDEITVKSVDHLTYLNAVIQEGIRMGPPAAIGLPRITPVNGANICDEYVPGSTFVSVNQYPAFRSASNFESPDAFKPERFLPDSPFPSDRLDAFEPFLLGRHKCIGQKLAWTIMRLTLAKLLYSFDLRATENVDDFGQQDTYIFWDKKPLKLELRAA